MLNDDNNKNSFESVINWVKKQDELVTLLQYQAALKMGKGRVLMLYFEKLKADDEKKKALCAEIVQMR